MREEVLWVTLTVLVNSSALAIAAAALCRASADAHVESPLLSREAEIVPQIQCRG